MKIYKYSLADMVTTIELPFEHTIRHVGIDPQGTPSVRIELRPNKARPMVDVEFVVFPTGSEIDTNMSFAGTFIIAGFVGHVYLKTKF